MEPIQVGAERLKFPLVAFHVVHVRAQRQRVAVLVDPRAVRNDLGDLPMESGPFVQQSLSFDFVEQARRIARTSVIRQFTCLDITTPVRRVDVCSTSASAASPE